MFLHSAGPQGQRARSAFEERLAELGWIQGRNIEFILRYTYFSSVLADRFRAYRSVVAEVLSQKPDLIYAPLGPVALAAKQLTKDVPIVFSLVDDPVASGLVASLRRPDGNVTGVTTRSRELSGKRLQTLKEVVPHLRRIGLVRTQLSLEGLIAIDGINQAAAQLGLQMVSADHYHSGSPDVARKLADLKARGADAIVGLSYLHWHIQQELVDQASLARLPAVYDAVEFVEAGGLMSIVPSFEERYRAAAGYVDRILRGGKPGDLPVEEPTTFPMTVNLRAAKMLGLALPQALLLRADRIIE